MYLGSQEQAFIVRSRPWARDLSLLVVIEMDVSPFVWRMMMERSGKSSWWALHVIAMDQRIYSAHTGRSLTVPYNVNRYLPSSVELKKPSWVEEMDCEGVEYSREVPRTNDPSRVSSQTSILGRWGAIFLWWGTNSSLKYSLLIETLFLVVRQRHQMKCLDHSIHLV